LSRNGRGRDAVAVPMIAVPTKPAAHYAFDLSAWIGAALAARWQARRWPDEALRLSRMVEPSYFVSLALGALSGAWLFGPLNAMQGGLFAPSHSIAGALAGGIVAVELWKRSHNVRRSTGG